MKRADKQKREHLRKQVQFCKTVACDHYLAGNYEKEQEWEHKAIEYQDQILNLYPRFRTAKERAKARTIFVPIAIHPDRIEVTNE